MQKLSVVYIKYLDVHLHKSTAPSELISSVGLAVALALINLETWKVKHILKYGMLKIFFS